MEMLRLEPGQVIEVPYGVDVQYGVKLPFTQEDVAKLLLALGRIATALEKMSGDEDKEDAG